MVRKKHLPSGGSIAVIHREGVAIDELAATAPGFNGTTFRSLRTKAGLSQVQIAEVLGISRNAVVMWESGTSRPDLDRLVKLCALLGVSADTLLGLKNVAPELNEQDAGLLRYYHSLSERDRRLINNMMDTMHETDYIEFKKNFDDNFAYRRLSPLKVCAGDGIELGDAGYHMQLLLRINDVSKHCDEVIRITGDSMLPKYNDGDRVMVEHRPQVEYGDIGIFVLNGEGMIKEFRGDRLHPLNDAFEDIVIHRNDDLRCIGPVLGKITPEFLPTRDEQYMIDDLLLERRNPKKAKTSIL